MSGRRTSWMSLGVLGLLLVATAAVSAATAPPVTGVAAVSVGPAPPAGWQIVSYHGVHVAVPASWPVVDGAHAGVCSDPFPPTPTVFVGPSLSAGVRCSAVTPKSPTPVRAGVWLQPGGSRPVDETPVRLPGGGRLLEEGRFGPYGVEAYWYHGVSVDVGLGQDPATTARIIRSVGYRSGVPDTRALEACASSTRAGIMPTPQRLTRRLVLEHGAVTLDPPGRGDRATVAPAVVWARSEPKKPTDRYRLLLALYSARFPAVIGPGGSQQPVDHDELAWVLYGAPRTTAFAGCGLFVVQAFGAGSGQPIASMTYTPGP